MPEIPQHRSLYLEEALAQKELYAGDIISVKDISDFDTFAYAITERLVKKHKSTVGRDASWFRPSITMKQVESEMEEKNKFFGQYIHPRIIINEKPQDNEPVPSSIFEHEQEGKVIDAFRFTVAVDLKSSAGGIYATPAQVQCTIYITDHGEGSVTYGDKELKYKRIFEYMSTQASKDQVRLIRQSIRKRRFASITTAEDVERENLRQGPLPGSFETGRR